MGAHHGGGRRYQNDMAIHDAFASQLGGFAHIAVTRTTKDHDQPAERHIRLTIPGPNLCSCESASAVDGLAQNADFSVPSDPVFDPVAASRNPR